MPPTAFSLLTTTTQALLLVESRLSAAEIQGLLQDEIDAGVLDFEMSAVRRVDDYWNDLLAPDRARATVTVTSAVLVLVLAAFGYFGMQRFLVASGRREYAILSAMGAGPRAIGHLVLARSIRQGLPGVVLGCLLAVIAVAWMQDGFIAPEVSPVSVAAMVAVGVIALLLAATIGPAHQAQATDPAPLLKEE